MGDPSEREQFDQEADVGHVNSAFDANQEKGNIDSTKVFSDEKVEHLLTSNIDFGGKISTIRIEAV